MNKKKLEIIENCIETFNAIEYFEVFRMKELLKKDKFYIKHLIKHIKHLENEKQKMLELFNLAIKKYEDEKKK